jgi:hypothetical protein
MQSDCSEQNRSLHSLVGVEQVPPRLAIAFKSTASIDVDILAAKQEEASRVLEVKLKCILLPEVGVVRECDAALNVHVYVRQVA